MVAGEQFDRLPGMFIRVRIFSVPHPDHPAAMQILAVTGATLFLLI
jgi:hypothetical protein